MSYAQMVEYNIIHNQPAFPKYSLNLDLMNMDANFNNFDNLSFNLGLWGYVGLSKNLETQFSVRQSYLQMGRLLNRKYVGNSEANVGAAFFLKESTRNENVRVILKQDVIGPGYATLTNFIMVPAKVSYKFGVQGGLHFRSSPFDSDDSDESNMTNTGFYAGVVLRRANSLKISLGEGTALNSANYDFYFDALFLPFNTFKSTSTGDFLTKAEVDLFRRAPLGFRAGCKLYQADVKSITGKRFGMCYNTAFGIKPYQGWFIECGIGITLLKK
jgi:hypothetical protein